MESAVEPLLDGVIGGRKARTASAWDRGADAPGPGRRPWSRARSTSGTRNRAEIPFDVLEIDPHLVLAVAAQERFVEHAVETERQHGHERVPDTGSAAG